MVCRYLIFLQIFPKYRSCRGPTLFHCLSCNDNIHRSSIHHVLIILTVRLCPSDPHSLTSVLHLIRKTDDCFPLFLFTRYVDLLLIYYNYVISLSTPLSIEISWSSFMFWHPLHPVHPLQKFFLLKQYFFQLRHKLLFKILAEHTVCFVIESL